MTAEIGIAYTGITMLIITSILKCNVKEDQIYKDANKIKNNLKYGFISKSLYWV